MPFFSVVIPVYNRARFISATFHSVLSQAFKDVEIIVVNDGSTDESETIIKALAASNPAIIYIYQENSERGAARNKGLRQASGQYVVFLDSDDLMEEKHLQLLHEKIQSLNQPDFITSKYVLKQNNKQVIPPTIQNLAEGYYGLDLFLEGAHFGCNIAVKKSNPNLVAFEEDRKYAIMEDWMFFMKNLEHNKIYITNDYSIIMNDHEERSMRGKQSEIISKRILATAWIEKNVSLNDASRNKLQGSSWWFCAVHSYLGGKRNKTFQYLFKSVRHTGLTAPKVMLFIKSIIGRKFIQRLG